ncbi:MAG: autotransporter-associated beta strand repeat-containing protein [Armatimonas sp.]
MAPLAINTITKTGLGTLTVGADSTFAGILNVNGGALHLSDGGKLLELSTLNVNSGATMALDNTTTNLADRLGDANSINLTSGTLRFLGNAGTTSQETTGQVNLAGLDNVLQVEASGGQTASLLLSELVTPFTTINALRVRGTNIAATSGTAGHVFLKSFNGSAPDNGQLLVNVTAEDLSNPGVFANAIYDTAVGIRPVLASDYLNGAVLQNAAPTNTPTTANFRVDPSIASTVPVVGTSNRVYSLRFAPGGVLDYSGSVASQLSLTHGIIETEPGAAASITNSGTRPLTIRGSDNLNFTTNADLTVWAALTSQAFGLTKNGLGTLTLNGAYSVMGGLTVNAGTLNLNSTPTAPDVFGNGLRINGGTFNLGVGAASFSSLNGAGGTLNLGSGYLTLTTNGGNYSGIITGTGGLINNSSTLTLGGANTFSGGITSTSVVPSYIINHPSALGTGTLDLSSQTQSSFTSVNLGYEFGTAGAVGTVANNIILPSGAVSVEISKVTLRNDGQTLRLTGLLSGGGPGMFLTLNDFVLPGGNMVVLDNPNNTFMGTIQDGFGGGFAITSNGALGNANNPIRLSNNFSTGSMRFDANNITVGSGHTVTMGGGSINTNGNNATIAGVLAGTAGFNKIGAGALTLSNTANTFSGPIRITGGSLLVNGNLAGGATLTVAYGGLPGEPIVPGGTLGGSGTIGAPNALRDVYIENGATLAPGNSPGLLTVNGNVTFAPHFDFYADPNFAVELNGTTVGTGYDQLAVNGAVDLGSANLLLSLGFAPGVNDMFFLVSNDGTDAILGNFLGLPEGSSVTGTYGGMTYTGQITYQGDFGAQLKSGGNDIALFGFALGAAVPEPGSMALFAFVALPGAILFHRKRK